MTCKYVKVSISKIEKNEKERETENKTEYLIFNAHILLVIIIRTIEKSQDEIM